MLTFTFTFTLTVSAIGLMLIFEGILPFLSPNLWRRMVEIVSKKSDRVLRVIGLICILLGITLLFISQRFL